MLGQVNTGQDIIGHGSAGCARLCQDRQVRPCPLREGQFRTVYIISGYGRDS